MEEVNGLNGHEHNGLAEQEQKQPKPVHSEVELTKKDTTIQEEESQVTKVTLNGDGTASVTSSVDASESSSNEASSNDHHHVIEPQLESPSSLSSDLEPKKEVSSSEAIIESHDDERESSPPVVIVGTLKKKRIPPGDLELHDSKDDNVPQNGDDLSPPQTPSIVITESPVQVFEEEYIGEQEDEKVLEQLVNKVQVEVQVKVQEEEPKAVEVEEVKVEVAPTVVEVVTSPTEITEEVAIQQPILEPIQEPVEVKVEVSSVVVEVTSPPEVKVEKVEEKLEDQVDAPVKPARSRPPSVILVDSPKAERSKKPEPSPKPKPETLPKPKIVEQPKSLNPFGDDDEEEEEAHEDDRKSIQSSTPSNKSGQSATAAPKIYPTDLNPFGDEEEEEVEVPRKKPSATDASSASLNPFGDFDDEEEEEGKSKHIPSPAPRKTLTSTSTAPTPSPQPPKSPRGTRSPLKKRQAPAPPPKPVASPVVGVSVPSPAKSTQSLNNALDNNTSSTCDNSPSTSASSSVANSRTPTPVPRRSKQPTQDGIPDSVDPEQLKQIKSKKRPAPPIPAFKRSLKSSMDEIEAELNQIGDELPVVEQKRQELETWLLDEQKKVNSKTESNETQPTEDAKEPKVVEEESTENRQAAVATECTEYEEKMNEFIDVAKKRCKLAQKQKELMYMKREHKLEETQVDIEFQLRKIMSKQDAQKSEEDKTTEADLLQRMMEIIDERNDIIENMIKDENKEIEDYLLLISKVLPEQAKALTPSALHEAPEGAKDLVTSPQPHKHLSASKLLKQKTASTLSLLKLKKKKKKDKDKDKLKQDGGEKSEKPVKDKTDGSVVVVSEPSDDEHDHSIATTENGSLRASMASIDAIPEDTAVSPIPDAKSTRSESRASLPAEPTEAQPKDPELKKHKKSFTISKSTFKKLSKITGVGGHHHHKEPTTGTSTTGSSTNDVTTATITKSPDSTQPPKVTES